MNLAGSSRRNHYRPLKPPNYAFRKFGGLKVRHKLALLHNIFFFVLAVSVYLSVIPLFSSNIGFVEGPASAVGLPAEGQQYLEQHPGATWPEPSGALIRNAGAPGVYRRISVPREFDNRALGQARMGLFLVLGTIYFLSIVVLEFIIMPQYVYQPLTLMLKADEATQQDDREHELIDAEFILDDEIGQIMHSRNVTVAQLRRQEDDLANALKSGLDWSLRQRIDALAPTRITVPSGMERRIEYAHGQPPVLAVKLQELFGLADTPRIGGGRIPVTLHLLSPAGRPIQVTQDLKGFWERTYPEVRKELKGRYPRHPWPDDPWTATPTHRAKPRERR